MTPRDRVLVSQVADDIDEAKQCGDRHFQVTRPAGLTLSDDDFERAVVAELGRRGRIERNYRQ